jgi:mannosyl-3-phosphoglycerate phosphatase
MGLDFPFVSENGGGIFFPLKYEKDLRGSEFSISEGFIKLTLGKPYKDLLVYLEDIAEETGLRIRGFSQMNREEVKDLTGLTGDQCRLALEREFDEPFIVEGPEAINMESLFLSAEKRGLRISEGGRFFHLHGDSNKGRAADRLVSFFKKQHAKVYSIALGDSPNDFGMFDVVDQPVLIKSSRSITDINIKEKYPGIIITDKYGPEGWNEAVMGLLKTEREVLSNV